MNIILIADKSWKTAKTQMLEGTVVIAKGFQKVSGVFVKELQK